MLHTQEYTRVKYINQTINYELSKMKWYIFKIQPNIMILVFRVVLVSFHYTHFYFTFLLSFYFISFIFIGLSDSSDYRLPFPEHPKL